MIRSLFWLTIFFACVGFAAAQDLKVGAIINRDPSTEPGRGQPFRFRADFNNDGIPDVALSGDREGFGNAGGMFSLYLGTASGKWRYVGDFSAHPLAAQVEKGKKGEGILWVYGRSGNHKGILESFVINEKGIKASSSKELLTGDEDPGKAEYDRRFNGAAALKAEVGTTVAGKTTWSPYER